MEQAFKCLDIQESSSRDMSKQSSTELDYKLAAAPIQQKSKTFNLCYKEITPPASSTLQLNRYYRDPFQGLKDESLTTYRLPECPEPPLGVSGPFRDEEDNQETMDCD